MNVNETFVVPREGISIQDIVESFVRKAGRKMEEVKDVFVNHPTDATRILIIFDDSEIPDSIMSLEINRTMNA